MIKVIIAEDELLVRLGLVSSIDWLSNGFEIVGEASNGLEALDLCVKHDPHLVISDIKMPQMDGLELVRELKKRDLQAKIVILSCYDEFSYAQEALKYGVVSYLLKSDISPKKMTEVLVDLKSEYWHKNNDLIERSTEQQNYKYERRSFLEDVLFFRVSDEDNIRSGIEKYGLKIADINYFTCAAKLNLSNRSDLQTYNSKQLLTDTVSGLLVDCIGRFGIGEVLPHAQDEIIIVISFPQVNSKKKLWDIFGEFCSFVRDSLKRCLGLTMTLGVSDVHNGYENLGQSCNEAIRAIDMHFFLGQDRIIYYDSIASNTKSEVMIPEVNDYFNRVVNAINQNDRDEVLGIFDELGNVFIQRQVNSQDSKWFFYCMIFKYFEQIHFLNMKSVKIWGDDEYPDVRISKMNTLTEVIEYSKHLTFLMMENILSARENEKNMLISRAQKFIEDNYNKEISLHEVAEYLNINSTYLCKLFSQVSQETFVDYLTKVRIKHAQYYLSNTANKIYEISEKIGYNSPEYFCRAFRKKIGLSPYQYRAGVRNGD